MIGSACGDGPAAGNDDYNAVNKQQHDYYYYLLMILLFLFISGILGRDVKWTQATDITLCLLKKAKLCFLISQRSSRLSLWDLNPWPFGNESRYLS